MKKFWNWQTGQDKERTLFLNGTIAEESWYDDDVTPALFRSELEVDEQDIVVWINSPGGDCIAAAQIYNMLKNYKGKVTIKIDGIAASAASVIAMAGDEVVMSPVSMLMIHNPMTAVFGDKHEMGKAIKMLDEVKESIINAYVRKTKLPRDKLSNLMDKETWMNSNYALELGFIDGITEERQSIIPNEAMVSMHYDKAIAINSLIRKIQNKTKNIEKEEKKTKAGDLLERLSLLNTWR
ncbi:MULTISPECIES: head maturation protease, ClpP-related [unclassified Gemella]|uniref:head maturation protease, ClpP-related n=1 Tax=unclassified Gemella TaxID=2624949 RepID=UPI001073DBFB|nr:Clp protease ClpP [Gemella sp. GL1.1]MBF0746588.1 Clp protease ClpP [Gemella sp. 19428wG2_WT2a]NYS27814.1 Clp protease ClpP [Gemella sp. GL1]TFU60096.1 Clp protease ClpP [Gemella sp. WT2a]